MKRLLLVAVVLASACATPATPTHLTSSFGETFAGLYAQQQRLLGREGARPLEPLASCRRTGADADGPGEDWVCSVQYTDLGTASAQAFEVQVKPDGCWTATGPPATQPAQVVDAVTQASAANPLAQFDGCLDTSW